MRKLVVLLALLLGSVTGASAQMRPHARWQQIDTEHFRVVFEPGLDSIAQHAARRAEVHHARLSAELTRPPKAKITIVIGDNFDYTNGLASPFPFNAILLWAHPPVEEHGLGYFSDWMDLVVAHELTHIFHLDRAGKVGRAVRTVFGRLPFLWPIFPVVGIPDWMLEGLATYRETVHTGTGRVRASYHDMVLRTSVLENDFDPIDRVSGETPTWPAGQRAYIHGSMFLDYVAQQLGPEAMGKIVDETAGSLFPPPLVVNRIASEAVGRSFTQLYDEWYGALQHRYRALADTLRQQGITPTERIAGGERQSYFPRISPDGKQLAFVQEDGRNSSSIIVQDLASGEYTRTRRNSLAPVAWLNHSTLATTQFDYVDAYTVTSDLYLQLNGQQQRVTRGARYHAIDADRAGTKFLAVQHHLGLTSLVARNASTGTERVIVGPRSDQQWVAARWSPDGSRIAAERWRLGGDHDIVVMDTLGNEQFTIASAQSLNTAPTWTPDGRFVVFASDRTGITNLYARDATVNDARIFEITNLLTGAFYPEVSPDGQYVYFSAYHSSGYAIERAKLDPASWGSVSSERTAPLATVNVAPQSGASLPVRDYSPFPFVLPKYWVPIIQSDSVQGTFIGAASSGNDAVGRHQWAAALGINFENGRSLGSVSYTFAGLGNPLLTLQASREYELLAEISVRREDNIALLATILRPRWRSNLALSMGVEGTVIRRDTMLAVRDAEDRLVGVIAGLSFGNARNPAYAISPEDGVQASLFARRRFDIDPVFNDDTYSELQGRGAAYKSIDGFGFAHHALAARASGVYRTGLGIGPTDIGGVDDFLPVRGFSSGDRIGFRAWSTSLEYRVPVAMIGRGLQLWPLFVDRVAASAFVDAGNTSCTETQRAIYDICPGNTPGDDEMLLSAGAEVMSNVAIGVFFPFWMRAGVAFPLQGPRDEPRFYLGLSRSF
jgi:hypothetical protein